MPRALPTSLGLLMAVALMGAPTMQAQEWTLDLYGGHVAYDLATSNLGETSALVGIRYRDPARRWLYLSSGIPFGSEDSLWGAAGLGTRLATDVGSFEIGTDLAGQGFVYRDPITSAVGTGGVLDVRPLATFVSDRARIELRSGWVGYGSSIESVGVSRGVHDSDLGVYLAPVPSVTLSGTIRHVRAEEGDYTFGGGQIGVRTGPVRFWGSLGAWTDHVLPTTEWGAGVSYRFDPAGRTVLAASVRKDATDPVYWNSPRERWSIGISRTLGGGSSVTALPRSDRSTIAPEIADGRVRIRIPKSAVSSTSASDGTGKPPAVAGDFTDWEPVPMEDEGEHWSAVFQLDPGVYRYSFRSPDGHWFVPESVTGRRPDGFGGYVAVLVVS